MTYAQALICTLGSLKVLEMNPVDCLRTGFCINNVLNEFSRRTSNEFDKEFELETDDITLNTPRINAILKVLAGSPQLLSTGYVMYYVSLKSALERMPEDLEYKQLNVSHKDDC